MIFLSGQCVATWWARATPSNFPGIRMSVNTTCKAGTRSSASRASSAEAAVMVPQPASSKIVAANWKLEWKDQAAVPKRFEAERGQYLPQCETASLDDYNSMGIYRIR